MVAAASGMSKGWIAACMAMTLFGLIYLQFEEAGEAMEEESESTVTGEANLKAMMMAQQKRQAELRQNMAETYIDDLTATDSGVGYGKIGLHGDMGYESLKVKLSGKKYDHAVSMHPNARSKAFVEYQIDKPWEKFSAKVGIADSASPHDRSLIFRVIADGRAVYESDPLSETGANEDVLVSFLNPISQLRLEVEVTVPNITHRLLLISFLRFFVSGTWKQRMLTCCVRERKAHPLDVSNFDIELPAEAAM
jgi:hypothetical protein